MTELKDALENGLQPSTNGTWTKPGSDDKHIIVTGDTGQIYIKNISGNDVLHSYDKDKDK